MRSARFPRRRRVLSEDDPRGTAAAPLPELSFEDRMATVEFRVAGAAHITVDGDACRGCTTRACVTACPAGLFVATDDGGVLFNYEQCFECGTCYLVCNEAGAITWAYPTGGFGVVFRSS
jgi:ferredoxin like protein